MDRQIKSEQSLSEADCYHSISANSMWPEQLGSEALEQSDNNLSRKLSSENKVCRVCGDKAISVNFNVITCESCKAFFRRNALKPKDFRCPFNGSCEITMASRKFCKKCRLRKCFEVGMMKEWIMSEEARLQKRQLIKDNREKRWRSYSGKSSTEKNSRKSSKIDIFDSPPATSSSLSSDERQSDSPNLVTSNDWTMPTNVESSPNRSTSNVDSIIIPKSVLLTLINRCQQNIQDACPQCPPPPILTRAWRIYESGGLNDDELGNNSTDGKSHGNSSLKCICSCICGAHSTATEPSDNGQKKEERKCSSNCADEWPNSNTPVKKNFVVTSGQEPSGAFRSIDYNRVSKQEESCQSTLGTVTQSIGYQSLVDKNTLNSHIQELLASRSALDGLPAQIGLGKAESRHPSNTYVITDPADFIRAIQGYGARIIEMSRSLTSFKNLSSEDQVALLRGGIRELLSLHSAMNYSHELDAWLPFGRDQPYLMSLQMINQVNPEFFEHHLSFIRSFAPQWSTDLALMHILAAMCLFDPNRPGVRDVDNVFRLQQLYRSLLKCYLINVYGQQEGLRVFAELESRLTWLHQNIDRMQPTFLLELSPHDMSPLMFQLLF